MTPKCVRAQPLNNEVVFPFRQKLDDIVEEFRRAIGDESSEAKRRWTSLRLASYKDVLVCTARDELLSVEVLKLITEARTELARYEANNNSPLLSEPTDRVEAARLRWILRHRPI